MTTKKHAHTDTHAQDTCRHTHVHTHNCVSHHTVSAQPLGRAGGGGKGHIIHQRLLITQGALGLGFLLFQGFYPVRTDENREKSTSEAKPTSGGATEDTADPILTALPNGKPSS